MRQIGRWLVGRLISLGRFEPLNFFKNVVSLNFSQTDTNQNLSLSSNDCLQFGQIAFSVYHVHLQFKETITKCLTIVHCLMYNILWLLVLSSLLYQYSPTIKR